MKNKFKLLPLPYQKLQKTKVLLSYKSIPNSNYHTSNLHLQKFYKQLCNV